MFVGTLVSTVRNNCMGSLLGGVMDLVAMMVNPASHCGWIENSIGDKSPSMPIVVLPEKSKLRKE